MNNNKLQSYYATNTKQKAINETARWKNIMDIKSKKLHIEPNYITKIKVTEYPTSKYYIH